MKYGHNFPVETFQAEVRAKRGFLGPAFLQVCNLHGGLCSFYPQFSSSSAHPPHPITLCQFLKRKEKWTKCYLCSVKSWGQGIFCWLSSIRRLQVILEFYTVFLPASFVQGITIRPLVEFLDVKRSNKKQQAVSEEIHCRVGVNVADQFKWSQGKLWD